MTADVWDTYYFRPDPNGSLTATEAELGPGNSVSGETTVVLENPHTFAALTRLANGKRFYDSVDRVKYTFLGTATVKTDGGTGTVMFAIGRPDDDDHKRVILMLTRPGAFTSQADFIAKNPSFNYHSLSAGTVTFCFYAGTMIRTADGDRAVEKLAQGDVVVTAGGSARPIRWIGRSTKARLFSDPVRVLPIRIRAGALGENLPARDLLVSPGHAVLIDGVLVQAGALLNGRSIVRAAEVPALFDYYHVDTGRHELLFAEGVPAESFLMGVEDTGFDNLADRPADSGLAPTEMAYPRVKAARQVPTAVRELIARRGAAIAMSMGAAA
jgi:hypothetical protein